MRITLALFTTYLIFFCVVCNSNSEPLEAKKIETKTNKKQEVLIKTNKAIVKKEKEDIEAYIIRNQLNMNKTESGLYYIIYNPKEKEPLATSGKTAFVNYKISLLDGTICYTSDAQKPESFIIDHDHVEKGIHEGIKLMRKGEKAKFILPSHLAHGLIGDQNKIPAMAVVVYDIDLVNLH